MISETVAKADALWCTYSMNSVVKSRSPVQTLCQKFWFANVVNIPFFSAFTIFCVPAAGYRFRSLRQPHKVGI